MTRYRERTAEVEAWQVGSDEPIPEWVNDFEESGHEGVYVMDTPAGLVFALHGEWVVDDPSICDSIPDKEFEQTYEVVG